MADQRLGDLEGAAQEASRDCYQKYEAMTAAREREAAAKEALNKAANDAYRDEYDQKKVRENQEKLQKARQELKEAKEASKAAASAFEESSQAAQAAQDSVEAKMEELRNSRTTDTSFAVLMARSECNFGSRTSYLALDHTHGVYTKGMYQMTVKDMIANTNVINFCTCKSKENPKVIEAAQKVADEANAKINEQKGFRDYVLDLFVKPKEIEVTDSLLEQCVGECILELVPGSSWSKGQEKVSINGEAPLLRRCELTCKYGGRIILLLSGQPE